VATADGLGQSITQARKHRRHCGGCGHSKKQTYWLI